MKTQTCKILFLAVLVFFQNCSPDKELKVHDKNGVLRHKWIFETDTLTGKRITYWPNGQVKEIHDFKNGKLDGEYVGYYENGHIARSSHFYSNVIRGAALKFFEHSEGLVESETYFLDVMGKQYAYYHKTFDTAGRLISEERTVNLDFECKEGQKLAQINFVDHFSYDSAFIITGDFSSSFSIPQSPVSLDTIKVSRLPVSVELNSKGENNNTVRGKCIFFVGTHENDSNLVNVKLRWFEEKIPTACQ